MKQLRPGTIIKDEAIPILLRQVKQPTFVTINPTDFWRRVVADSRYCIVCLTLDTEHIDAVPVLLRRLFRLPEFRTKARRMGKVALVSQERVQYYQVGNNQTYLMDWPESRRGFG